MATTLVSTIVLHVDMQAWHEKAKWHDVIMPLHRPTGGD